MYVDDMIYGAHSYNELIAIYDELKLAFSKGGFNLRK